MSYSRPVTESLGTPDRPLRVAVVGAGPSGFYTAAALLKAPDLAVRVDLYDSLPAPYGLVRYGVAPDHQKIKRVARVFEKAALDERVRFFGNVKVGEAITHEELKRAYDQVVYAVGGQSDRQLGIPGEELTGSLSSTELVYWYSGHPEYQDLEVDLSAEAAVIVGIGNVAMDVARVLARSADDLATTDIADVALEQLRDSHIRNIHVVARRGPVQAKCTPPELKELGEIDGVAVVVDGEDLELDAASERAMAGDRQATKNLELLREYAGGGDGGEADRRIHFHFLVSPRKILGRDGRVVGVELERNRLEEQDDGYLASVGTGEHEDLPAGLVIRAVGYRSLPVPGLPFDDRRGRMPNRHGRVWDPRADQALPGVYAVGWVKRGPTGLIGSNKPDAQETVDAMLEDLPVLAAAPGDGAEEIRALLEERGVRRVTFEEWQRLDRLEVETGEAQGRPRVKLCRVEDMLGALDGRALEIASSEKA